MSPTRHAPSVDTDVTEWSPSTQPVSVSGGVTSVRDTFQKIDDNERRETLTVITDHVHMFVSRPETLASSLLTNWFNSIRPRDKSYRSVAHDGRNTGSAKSSVARTPGFSPSEQATDAIR